jgi:hypothetical protein
MPMATKLSSFPRGEKVGFRFVAGTIGTIGDLMVIFVAGTLVPVAASTSCFSSLIVNRDGAFTSP